MMFRSLVAASLASAAEAAPKHPHILHIVVDDFGYKDMGHKNGIVESPTMDALATGGIQLTDYYTFTVCAPSRASIMTGRYAWGLGYYWVGGDSEAVDTEYDMLPKVLKEQGGYETAMIGKWHCGAILKEHTPTYRGFDSYYGYYHAATNSYWYHGGEGGGCQATDFTNNTGEMIRGAEGMNGTYITHAFTDHTVDRINRHDPETPLYIYLAHMATHDASGMGMQAPRSTVDRYTMIEQDAYKMQAAATTELDWSIGNITDALKQKKMWDNTVVVLVSDNGGPLGHTINEPLRGGKHSYWEGGLRAEAFVYSELLPKKVQGTKFSGLAHTSDWYNTLIEGVAGLTLPGKTGPRAPDGKNLWPALTTGGKSPREEVILQVENEYSEKHSFSQAGVIRVGDFKLIMNDPGEDSLVAYPSATKKPVEFGLSGGEMEDGTDHATCGGLKDLPGLKKAKKEKKCVDKPCLFNVVDDVSESDDLADKKEHADLIKDLQARLAKAAKEGPEFADTPGDLKKFKEQQCALAESMGFVEPADCGDACGVSPAPTPEDNCDKALAKECAHEQYPEYDDCLQCSRNLKDQSVCNAKERKAYCDDASVLV